MYAADTYTFIFCDGRRDQYSQTMFCLNCRFGEICSVDALIESFNQRMHALSVVSSYPSTTNLHRNSHSIHAGSPSLPSRRSRGMPNHPGSGAPQNKKPTPRADIVDHIVLDPSRCENQLWHEQETAVIAGGGVSRRTIPWEWNCSRIAHTYPADHNQKLSTRQHRNHVRNKTVDYHHGSIHDPQSYKNFRVSYYSSDDDEVDRRLQIAKNNAKNNARTISSYFSQTPPAHNGPARYRGLSVKTAPCVRFKDRCGKEKIEEAWRELFHHRT